MPFILTENDWILCIKHVQVVLSINSASLQKTRFFFNIMRLLTERVKTEEMGISFWGSKFTLEVANRLVKFIEIASTQPLVKKHV